LVFAHERKNQVMTMRILLLNPNTSAEITGLLAREARALAREVDFVPSTAAFGPRYIGSRVGAAIAGHAAVDAYTRAAEGGCAFDAIILACFGDPGLAALREIAPCPVIGMADAAIHTAAQRGRRFALLTGGARWVPMLQEFVAALGMADRLAAVRCVPQTGAEIAADPGRALPALADLANRCAAEDGADVVVLGGAGLAGLAARLAPSVRVPLVDSLAAAVGQAVALARAGGATGVAETGPPPVDSIGLSAPLTRLVSGGRS
jgi:Asp/Glu/hydantoin racemase